MIIVVDYNLGNIKSVLRGFEKIGAPVKMTSKPGDIEKASGLVVPGVGAFKKAMQNLQNLSLEKPLKRYIKSGRPYLGICLGLQILFTRSCEHGFTPGLNIIKGRVEKFKPDVKIPHMGWNTVDFKKTNPLVKGIERGSYFYFDHSYYVMPEEKLYQARTDYGGSFTCAVMRDKIYGVQFHPEKSGEKGLKMLKNFSKLCLVRE